MYGRIRISRSPKTRKKEYKSRVSKGQFPYLPVLDEILKNEEIQTEQNLGLVHLPLEFVVEQAQWGERFLQRTLCPSRENTEFCMKWTSLSDAQVNEGIRDPIIAYEYMNRYYVVEGNKRVSVLKYFKANEIPAIVTRKIPKYNENDESIKLYYEFMKFNEITGLCSIEFTRLGKAEQLLNLMGKTNPWDENDKEEFKKILFNFSKAYYARGGKQLPITIGDALVAFMTVFGYKKMLDMTEESIPVMWKKYGMNF